MTKGTETIKTPNQSVLSDIMRSAQLVWRLMLDPRVPGSTKLLLPGILIYVLSPIDLVPEGLLLMLGMVDDLAVVYFGIKLFIHLCPPDVVEEHRRALGDPAAARKAEYVDGTYRVVDDK